MNRHTISVLVENKPGVLARISGLFSARGYNIDSLAVGETDDPDVSRMTIIVRGDERVLDQVEKQLAKLVDVLRVIDFVGMPHVERDLALVKMKTTPQTRIEIMQIAEVFRAKVVDISKGTLTLELTGPEEKIQALVDLMKPFGIKEVVRTGIIAMARGSHLAAERAPEDGGMTEPETAADAASPPA